MRREPEIRVFCREMPLDLFLGMLTSERFAERLREQLAILDDRRKLKHVPEWQAVEAMRRELDRSWRQQDREQRGEWVICLPRSGEPFSVPVAVVRKYDNNGNTHIATPHQALGFFMAPEMLEPGGSPYGSA